MVTDDHTPTRGRRRRSSGRLAAALTVLVAAALPTAASAHLERPSYWPDPRPDTSVTPAAGGAVPTARSLSTAVSGKGPGVVRVVCQRNSLALVKRAIADARSDGWTLRPSQRLRRMSRKSGARLLKINRSLKKRCRFDSVQDAVTASGNNDRIVIMPGRYTEPKSRARRVNDPACNPSLLQDDQRGQPTPSYGYHAKCPNDQNLIHVLGRAVKGEPLEPPKPDRHGIPQQELGACVRCNLQIEGSGVIPEDVLLDAGDDYERPRDPQDRPQGHAKHVVLRTDRSDGLVVRNVLMRGAKEHGFYTEETDGVLLDKVKFFWNADYGHLSFTTDHNLIQNCDGFGSGDAVVYPGASPQTGQYRDEKVYPEQRFNSTVRWCDLHGSAFAYSGSMGNSVRITENHIYGNTGGISSDTLSAPGHPGFPADGLAVDHNYIYSNNLNLHGKNPPIEPLVPAPIGTGMVFAGMNASEVHHNWIFDNWRQGTVLMGVPDQIIFTALGNPEGNVDSTIHCPTSGGLASTSCANRYHHNVMGRVPPNFTWPSAIDKFGNKHGSKDATVLPNGVDFWWDEFAGNTGNCWYDNTGVDGTAASVTGSGAGTPPDLLPADCAGSVGQGDAAKEAKLLDCLTWAFDREGAYPICDWYRMPARPGTAAAARDQRAWERSVRAFLATGQGQRLSERLGKMAPGGDRG